MNGAKRLDIPFMCMSVDAKLASMYVQRNNRNMCHDIRKLMAQEMHVHLVEEEVYMCNLYACVHIAKVNAGSEILLQYMYSRLV